MSRIIKPDAKLIKKFAPQQFNLPTHMPVAQYIRQSTMGQVKHNLQSQIQQDEELREILVDGFGWPDNDKMIIPISIDQGKSGQKRQDERQGLASLYHMIENREIGAVAAYDASRLWRDPTHVWYNAFISDYLIPYNIPVIMKAQVYYPARQADMDALRDEFKQAAWQLRHIYEKVNPARLIAIQRGKSYGGHCVPMGYIVVGTTGDRHYQIYHPHAELVEWLFKRYRELGGSFAKLAREIQASRFKFPSFEGLPEGKVPHVALPFDGEGYPVRTRTALLGILTNPAYIGWYLFSKSVAATDEQGNAIFIRDANGNIKGQKKDKETIVISKKAHDPIVDYDLFMYAYSRLSPTTLDGEANENKPKVDRRFVRVPALLENVLESDGTPVYAMASKETYTARAYADSWKSTELVVRIDTLDKVVSNGILMVTTALEERHRKGLQDSMYEQLAALQQEKATEVKDFQKQLANIEKGIREAEMEKRAALAEEYEPGVRAAIKQLRLLDEAKTALEEKQSRAATEESEIAETKSLLVEVVTKWNKMPFERKKRFIKLMVLRANLTEATPHFLKIEIDLRDPLSCTLVGHFHRARGSKPPWSDEENEKLAALYPQADRKDVLVALPTRTWEAIVQQAGIKGVKRYARLNTSNMPESMTHADMALCERIDLPWPAPIHWAIPSPVSEALANALSENH
ncbi:MAG: recombinase family protein [Ktedonobacteraceae bacterium]